MKNNALHITQEKVDFLPAHRVTDDRSILTLKSLVFEPLCTWTSGYITPGLFESWDTEANGLVWNFHLRNNALFHDGTPCTAQDIVVFLTAICQSVDSFGMKWSYARYFNQVIFTAVSTTCLRVQTPHPIGDLPEIFSEFYLSKLDRSGHATIGTGSYQVLAFTPGVHTSLASRKQPAHILHFTAQKAPEDRLNLLRSNQVDIACQLDALSPLPDQDPAFKWLSATSCLSVMAYLNCEKGLFSHSKARQAINMAVDRRALCEQIYGGQAHPACTVVSPFHFGFNHRPLPYDPQKARTLFAELGQDLTVTLRTPTFMPEHAVHISLFIKNALNTVGIDVNLEIIENRPDYARQIGRKNIGDIALFDSSPHSTFRVLNDKISSTTRGIWWQGYNNTELENQITCANECISSSRRAGEYAKCLSILQTDPPWLYLAHPNSICATRLGIDGFSINHKGLLQLEKVQ